MVRITAYKKLENKSGDEFFALVVNGAPELIKSKETGRTYLTARKTTVATTFDELTCQSLIGSTLSGSVVKVPVQEPYDYQIPNSDEVVSLTHIYEYRDDSLLEDEVFEQEHELAQPI